MTPLQNIILGHTCPAVDLRVSRPRLQPGLFGLVPMLRPIAKMSPGKTVARRLPLRL